MFVKKIPKVSINVDFPTPGGPEIPILSDLPDFLNNFFNNLYELFLSFYFVDSIKVIALDNESRSDNNIFLYKLSTIFINY